MKINRATLRSVLGTSVAAGLMFAGALTPAVSADQRDRTPITTELSTTTEALTDRGVLTAEAESFLANSTEALTYKDHVLATMTLPEYEKHLAEGAAEAADLQRVREAGPGADAHKSCPTIADSESAERYLVCVADAALAPLGTNLATEVKAAEARFAAGKSVSTPSNEKMMSCFGQPATIVASALVTIGTPGDDVIVGRNERDIIIGLGGDDLICGLNGWDTIHGDFIFGESGHDRISGGKGPDQLVGGRGDDVLFGGTKLDVMFGGEGDDVLYGNEGWDIMYGDAGNDRLDGNSGTDVVEGGDGNDTVQGGTGVDFIFGNGGDDTMRGGDGLDTMRGGDGDDTMYGESGPDGVRGGSGNDRMWGGSGWDRIFGQSGKDYGNGGSGLDICSSSTETQVSC